MEEPLEVLKGCSAILSELDSDFAQNIYSHSAISLLAGLVADSVSRLDDDSLKEMSEKSKENI